MATKDISSSLEVIGKDRSEFAKFQREPKIVNFKALYTFFPNQKAKTWTTEVLYSLLYTSIYASPMTGTRRFCMKRNAPQHQNCALRRASPCWRLQSPAPPHWTCLRGGPPCRSPWCTRGASTAGEGRSKRAGTGGTRETAIGAVKSEFIYYLIYLFYIYIFYYLIYYNYYSWCNIGIQHCRGEINNST